MSQFHSAVHRSGPVRTQLEKQEGVEMVESNLDGIVGCVDYFPHMEDQVSCANVPPPDPFVWG